MNRDTQNIEFKQSWHDEYLKWICGFANAQGGKLVIGVDDAGNAVGVDFRLGEHASRPRNKNIAATFYRAGFIEAWGRGIGKICEGFAKAGLAVPVFESVGGGVRVTAMRPKYTFAPNSHNYTHGDTQGDTQSSGKNGGDRPQSWPESWPESWPKSWHDNY